IGEADGELVPQLDRLAERLLSVTQPAVAGESEATVVQSAGPFLAIDRKRRKFQGQLLPERQGPLVGLLRLLELTALTTKIAKISEAIGQTSACVRVAIH